ncbi:hypothetical protein MMC10_005427 [Thelotrema lepadinum]|nr:hypothetical protein [Thelotrema lepadinum]
MYSGSQIYRHQAIYPRLLRLKASSNLSNSPGSSKSSPNGNHFRLVSSWRDSDHKEEYERRKDDWEKDFKEQTRQTKKEYIVFQRLLKDDPQRGFEFLQRYIEKDPYRALFGIQAQRAWNPWRDSWSIYMRFGRPVTVNKTEKETSSTPSEQKDGPPQSPKEQGKSTERRTTVEKTKEEEKSKSSLVSGYEEFRIDPITMKKVPKSEPAIAQQEPTSDPIPPASVEANAAHLNIPVKKFEVASPENKAGGKEESTSSKPVEVDQTELTGFAAQPWLIREGFKPESKSPVTNESPSNPATSTPQASSTSKIQSALDRAVYWGDKKIPRAKRPKYVVPEDKTEDLDLLRASDIRAASGRKARKDIPSLENTRREREKLEEKFTEAEKKFTDEIGSVRDAHRSLASTQAQLSFGKEAKRNMGRIIEERSHSDPQHLTNRLLLQGQLGSMTLKKNQDLIAEFLRFSVQPKSDIPKNSTQERRSDKLKATDEKLDAEIKHVRDVFEKSEHKPKEQPILENESDKSAEVSVGNMSHRPTVDSRIGGLNAERKEREKTLVREIRDIYEDKYGIINTTHKQPVLEEPPERLADSQPLSNFVVSTEDSQSINKQPDHTPALTKENKINGLEVPEVQEPELTSEAMTPVVQDWPQSIGTQTGNDADADPLSAQGKKSSVTRRDIGENMLTSFPLEARQKSGSAFTSKPEEVKSNWNWKGYDETLFPSSANDEELSKAKIKEFKENTPTLTSTAPLPPGVQKLGPKSTSKLEEAKSILTSDKVLADTDTREPLPYVYRILAIDRIKQVVVAATTTSSLFQTSSPLRSASDILTHLDQPHKYFEHMGTLESQGFQLMAGTRSMLVYRKQLMETDSADSKPVREEPAKAQTQPVSSKPVSEKPVEIDEVEQLARSLKPWRQEPHFSGQQSPKERFISAYDRASQMNSVAEEKIAQQDKLGDALHDLNSNKQAPKRREARRPLQHTEGRFGRAFRKFFQQLGVVSAALVLLYVTGLWADYKAKEKEKAEQEERERQKKFKESKWLGY